MADSFFFFVRAASFTMEEECCRLLSDFDAGISAAASSSDKIVISAGLLGSYHERDIYK